MTEIEQAHDAAEPSSPEPTDGPVASAVDDAAGEAGDETDAGDDVEADEDETALASEDEPEDADA